MEATIQLSPPLSGRDSDVSDQDDLWESVENAGDRQSIQRAVSKMRDPESDDTSRDAEERGAYRVVGRLTHQLIRIDATTSMGTPRAERGRAKTRAPNFHQRLFKSLLFGDC